MFQFIIFLGLVSFFADIAYEGARGIIGPFFSLLGASGAVVATCAGLAEFAGYGLRVVSGFLTDRLKNYWLLTTLGYVCNLVVIPLFALAGSWQMAALLLVLERAGKALRTPSRDAMLSYACHQLGRGWGFGLHEAFDRFGGLLGPLLMFAILSTGFHFKTAFAVLSFPAACALITLYATYRRYPHPEVMEPSKKPFSLAHFPRLFWIFLVGAALAGAGTLDFAFVAYHWQKQAIITTPKIPLFYMGAIGFSAVVALIMGKWFDRSPKPSLYCGIVAGSLSPLFLLLGNGFELWIGVFLWGIGMTTQTALFRSIIAHLAPPEARSTAYGIFGVVFGLAWFLGSALIGNLYEVAIAFAALTSLALQLASFPFIKRLSIGTHS